MVVTTGVVVASAGARDVDDAPCGDADPPPQAAPSIKIAMTAVAGGATARTPNRSTRPERPGRPAQGARSLDPAKNFGLFVATPPASRPTSSFLARHRLLRMEAARR